MSQVSEAARQTAQPALLFGAAVILTGTVNAGNAAELQRSLRAAVAATLVDEDAALFIDVSVSGGGPGNVFGAEVMASTATDIHDAYVPLTDMRFDVVEGATERELRQNVNALLAGALATFEVIAWSKATGGSGSPWIMVIASTGGG